MVIVMTMAVVVVDLDWQAAGDNGLESRVAAVVHHLSWEGDSMIGYDIATVPAIGVAAAERLLQAAVVPGSQEGVDSTVVQVEDSATARVIVDSIGLDWAVPVEVAVVVGLAKKD